VDCSRPTEKKKEGKEEKDYPRRYGRRLEKESKHGKSTVNTIQEETLDRYKRLRNEVNRAIRQEEDKIRKQILRGFKGNPKRFYGYMRNMKTVKDNLTVLRKDDGELTTTDQETADLISAYFKEVYTVEDLENFAVVMGRDLNWKDTDLDFGVSVVMKKLQQLNSDKSPSRMLFIRCYSRNVQPSWQNRCR